VKPKGKREEEKLDESTDKRLHNTRGPRSRDPSKLVFGISARARRNLMEAEFDS
jgi:hypothetical protein